MITTFYWLGKLTEFVGLKAWGMYKNMKTLL